MEARLGVYDKPPYQGLSAAEGVNDQSAHLRAEGGHRQQERMIQAKRKSFDRATFNSYQAAEISPVGCPLRRQRALINANQTKLDYDDKIVSVGYEYNYKPGDVFQWHRKRLDGTVDTSYWLIYLQDLTELAYFKGDIRKCNYWVNWEDEYGRLHHTWFAIRGPVETAINSMQKSNFSIDLPNHTLHILMPKNEHTLKRFQRYAKFYIRGSDVETNSICWRVEATDVISMPGILEITAHEYYSNDQVDDLELGVVKDVAMIELPTEVDYVIVGESTMRPQRAYSYRYDGAEKGEWKFDTSLPLNAEIDGNVITLKWTASYSDTFTLSFGSTTKEIKVKSLFEKKENKL